MRAPIRVRALTDAEQQALEADLRAADASILRRCQILLASARGATAPQIARQVGCSDEWVRQVIRAFNADGLGSLDRRSTRPHTIHAAIDAAGGERLRELLQRSPRVFGKPTSVWTLGLVAEVCAEQGITDARVSGETIRRSLARLDVSWQRAKRWISSPDPAYTQKNDGAIG
jgi:transposase